MRAPAGSFCKAGVRFFCARPPGRFAKQRRVFCARRAASLPRLSAVRARPSTARSGPHSLPSVHPRARPLSPGHGSVSSAPACPPPRAPALLFVLPRPHAPALPSVFSVSPARPRHHPFFHPRRSAAFPFRAPGRCARLPLRRPSFPAPFPDTARLHRKGKRCPHQCGAPRGIPARAAGLTRRGCGPGFRACIVRFCGLPRAGGAGGGATVAAGHKTGLPRGRGAGIRRNGRQNRQAGPMSAVGGGGTAPASVPAPLAFAVCRAREGTRVAAQRSLPGIKPACRAGGARVSAGMVGKIVRPACRVRWAAGVRPRLPCLRRSILWPDARVRGRGWRRNGRCRA